MIKFMKRVILGLVFVVGLFLGLSGISIIFLWIINVFLQLPLTIIEIWWYLLTGILFMGIFYAVGDIIIDSDFIRSFYNKKEKK